MCIFPDTADIPVSYTHLDVYKRQMIENDAYCNDILIQSSAVSAAMNGFNRELLAAHIHSCVVRDIRDGKDEVVDELIATIQKLMK